MDNLLEGNWNIFSKENSSLTNWIILHEYVYPNISFLFAKLYFKKKNNI